jgi:tetratricopeptide (TPR) repeat protein
MLLADSLKSLRDQLFCKRLLFSFIMVVEKNSEKALAYLKQNPDLNLYMSNNGLPNYNIGAVYHYGGQYAQAINYYLLDEPLILKSFEPSVQLSFFREMADCYNELNEADKAIAYYEKAFAISKTSGSDNIRASITLKLSQLFAKQNDFKKAFEYTQIYQGYNEVLKESAKQREVALLELEREKKKHEKDLQNAADAKNRKIDLQYTSIAIAIAVAFMLLMVLGMFPTSKIVLRMLGFFSFICLFEFILILVDVKLHDFTYGEPLRLWLAKIVIIAMLVPFHHFLEHSVVGFLTSQKLQRFRKKFSFKKFRLPSKKMIAELEENMEEGSVH